MCVHKFHKFQIIAEENLFSLMSTKFLGKFIFARGKGKLLAGPHAELNIIIFNDEPRDDS